MFSIQAQPDNTDYHAALLDACLTVQTYDRQCEDSREDYLFELIKATSKPVMYRDALLACLKESKEAVTSYDTAQRFAILCRFVEQDPAFDRNLLRTYVTEVNFDGGGAECLFALVRLEGIDGLIFVARQFHSQLKSAGDEWRWLFGALARDLGELDQADQARLKLARQEIPLLDELFRIDEQQHQEPQRVSETHVSFAELIARGDKYLRFTKDWIAQATQPDLEAAAEALLAEQTLSRLGSYARLFGVHPYPLALEPLFERLLSSDDLTARLIADILGHVRHPDVRRLGLGALAEPDSLEIALYLLQKNYAPEDAAMILSSLNLIGADEQRIHRIGLGVLKLAEAYGNATWEWEQILNWAYRGTPCSLCRNGVVDCMSRLNFLSDQLVAECLHDADKDTVRLAREYSRKRHGKSQTEN
jgi:hypothetical protein